ncbi:MAG TPA: alpha/beta fold hydrolase [Gammaproteobacteria bacterium]|nr:alpha/beta fold hydrolase [Gammaproteobacteria bacterium]
MNEAGPEPERDQERELEALLELSRRGRAKLERLHEVLTTPGHYGTGATPAAVVYRENKLRLLRLLDETGKPREGHPPVLFVPAPVSRYFIMDLLPGRSFAGYVAATGFDVYIADFGTPSREDRFADLEYYVEGLVRRCVRTVSALTGEAAINIVGYCLGGTLSLLYSALHPETVRRLVLLTTTVDGDVEGGIPWVAHRMGLAGEDYDNPRLVPAAEVKSWFEMLAPGSNSTIGRVSDLWERLDDAPERLREVRTMSSWVDDVVPAPGRLLAELYRKLGPGANGLLKGTATVGEKPIELAAVAMPVLSVSAEKDTIAPAAGVDAVRNIVSHAEILRLPGGHVGIVAGRSAATLWKRTVEFLGAGEGLREA